MAEISRRHCLSVEFTGDMNESVGRTFRGGFQNFLKAVSILNSDSVGGKRDSADAYDGAAISHTADRFPGSRVIADRNNYRGGR